MKERLTIALQKSGRLSNESQNVLKKSGVKFQTRDGKLLIKSNSFPIDILFVRDDDIPNLVNNGDADLAIIGQNELLEKTLSNNLNQINTLLNLGFSKCRLSFAIPEGMNFESLKDMKIATSYPNIVKNYLNKNSINAYVSDIQGSVELMPHIGICDCICDLVSSGATLEANNLRELETIMNSEAVLISNTNIKTSKQQLANTLANRIKGIIVGDSEPGNNLQITSTLLRGAFNITYLLSLALITPFILFANLLANCCLLVLIFVFVI